MPGIGIGLGLGMGVGAGGGEPVEPGEFHPLDLNPVAFYNRNDLGSMLQAFSNSGMNRVTAADQPVGVAMDVAQPKGSEMVSNGTFDSDIAGWESTAGWAGGDAIWTADGIQVTTDNYQGKLQQITCEVGKTYLLRFRVVSVGGGASSGRVYVSGLAPTVPNSGAVLNLQNLAVGQHAAIFTATMATHSIGLSTMQSAGVIVYDDISLVEIPGYHMTQATSGARPTIKLADSGNYYLDFDGSDDELAGTFPDLGSNCTVARSIPGVGAEILTGQSINGAFSDSIDSHVLLIFDGPLSAGDTAKLSTWLDGVADGSVDPAPPEESEPMAFLMESGDEMLLEDGGPILLEDE